MSSGPWPCTRRNRARRQIRARCPFVTVCYLQPDNEVVFDLQFHSLVIAAPSIGLYVKSQPAKFRVTVSDIWVSAPLPDWPTLAMTPLYMLITTMLIGLVEADRTVSV